MNLRHLILALAALIAAASCVDASKDGHLVPATVEHDESLPQLAFNDSIFHLETRGDPDDPVIIVLHGGPGSDYRSLLPLLEPVDGQRLEDEHFVVIWDQRGSGLSMRHDAGEIDLATYDADLDWLVDHFSSGRPVVLLGHSWGGMYASRYISLYPDKVAGAILMEPGPLTGQLFEEIKADLLKLAFFSEWLNDLTWAHRIFSPDDHARADYLWVLAMLGDSQPGFHEAEERSPVWRLGAVASAAVQEDGMEGGKGVWDFTVGLDTFAPKVLFMASALNTVIGEDFQRRQMTFFANVELEVIANSGHDHPFTRPQETLRSIVAYLGEIGF